MSQVSPHSPQPVRVCITSPHFSNPTFPLLTSVQSHCHLKTPSLFQPQVLCTCCPSRVLFPQFSPQLALSPPPGLSSNVTSSGPPRPRCPTLLFQCGSMLLDFLYKATSECPYAFMYVYSPFPQGVISTGVSPCWFVHC